MRLQEYDQDRTNLLARTVHDFSGPLTALSGYCGLLLSQQVGPVVGEQLDMLQRMSNSINRLNRTASALINLSRADQPEAAPDMQPDDIEAAIGQALLEVTPIAKEKNLALVSQIKPPDKLLVFDRTQIEQILINLLDNACKFTPRNGHVKVRGYTGRRNASSGPQAPELLHEDDVDFSSTTLAYYIEISDSGPGIPADKIESIFENYNSYSGSKDRSGAGLGLAICRTILQRHKGRIFATSTARGVTFTVVLPVQAEREPQAKPWHAAATQ